MHIILARIGDHPTVRFAQDELLCYLKQMDPSLHLELRAYDTYVPGKDFLWLGLDGSVTPSVDDEISIDVNENRGIITASNERAVLIAAYRFLAELGCRWLRPGPDGEVIPHGKLDPLSVKVQEAASYRHRAVCIEGAVSYEHVLNVIEWLPKVAMNGYFVQFFTPTTFFARWYNEDQGDGIPASPVTDEDVAHIWKRLEEEIVKRDLLYHAIGHGWTCVPFGIPGSGWEKLHMDIDPEITQYLAEVNGKRELWGGVGLNTNLCYSNPVVREKMTDAILQYCQANPAVKYLHFWLADSANSQCECEECRKMIPSDYYVLMLNELDKKLTDAGVETKIVFLIYLDLLWAPERLRIENPDRFVLMFAPISRTYLSALTDFDRTKEVNLPPYVRNALRMPGAVSENVALLSRWQEQFDGDSFDFDYHLMWHHQSDPGYMRLAKVLHTDMAKLDEIGLNGMVSCQNQRVSFPTGLPMYSMAKALWDKNSAFEDVCEEYFAAAFGKDGPAVQAYLTEISGKLNFYTIHEPDGPARLQANCAYMKDAIAKFQADYLDDKANENPSWHYLALHADLCLRYADILTAHAQGNKEKTFALIDAQIADIRAHITELHPVYDTYIGIHRIFKIYFGYEK